LEVCKPLGVIVSCEDALFSVEVGGGNQTIHKKPSKKRAHRRARRLLYRVRADIIAGREKRNEGVVSARHGQWSRPLVVRPITATPHVRHLEPQLL